MKRKRYSHEQIAFALRQAENGTARGSQAKTHFAQKGDGVDAYTMTSMWLCSSNCLSSSASARH